MENTTNPNTRPNTHSDTRLSIVDKRQAFAALHKTGCFVIPNPVALELAQDFMRRVARVDLYQCPCCQLGRLRLVETLRGCKTLPAPGAHNAITPQCTGPP